MIAIGICSYDLRRSDILSTVFVKYSIAESVLPSFNRAIHTWWDNVIKVSSFETVERLIFEASARAQETSP